jgi:hypothetical protein
MRPRICRKRLPVNYRRLQREAAIAAGIARTLRKARRLSG